MVALALDLETRPLRPIEELEDEITLLAGQINAATYRLLELIRELDERDGWLGPGLKSCAHWLNWKTGIALSAAREKVRVAHALVELPKVSEAFRLGKVSYSKVRAITRIATPATEEYLLDIALNGTASHVEKVVRGYRKTKGAEETAAANASHEARYLHTYWDDDGMLVIEARLPAEEGARFRKAIQAALPPDKSRSKNQERDHKDDPSQASYAQRSADALVTVCERSLAAHGTSTDADRFQVVVHVDAEVLADPEADGQCRLEAGPNSSAETCRRLTCDSSVVVMTHGARGEVLDVGRKRRTIPPAIRRALQARDDGCRWPGCTCRSTAGHHLQHWANGGATKLSNLLSLCHRHHQLAHEGGYAIALCPDGAVEVHEPNGRLVPSTPPQLPPSEVAALREEQRRAGIHIDAQTGVTLWSGERLDLEEAVEGVFAAESLASETSARARMAASMATNLTIV